MDPEIGPGSDRSRIVRFASPVPLPRSFAASPLPSLVFLDEGSRRRGEEQCQAQVARTCLDVARRRCVRDGLEACRPPGLWKCVCVLFAGFFSSITHTSSSAPIAESWTGDSSAGLAKSLLKIAPVASIVSAASRHSAQMRPQSTVRHAPLTSVRRRSPRRLHVRTIAMAPADWRWPGGYTTISTVLEESRTTSDSNRSCGEYGRRRIESNRQLCKLERSTPSERCIGKLPYMS